MYNFSYLIKFKICSRSPRGGRGGGSGSGGNIPDRGSSVGNTSGNNGGGAGGSSTSPPTNMVAASADGIYQNPLFMHHVASNVGNTVQVFNFLF